MPTSHARTVVITQPTFMPWLGYFEQVARADVFVFLDTVQFVARSWHSRNRLKGANGQPFWLTVPVRAHPRSTPLRDICIARDQSQWRMKHLRSIQIHLGSAPCFGSVFPPVRDWMLADHEYLADFTIAGIQMVAALLRLSPRFVRASELHVHGQRTALLVNLCREVGATRYYSSAGARVYMEDEEFLFGDAGIELIYQAWQHPTYRQLGSEFVSHMAVLDALMNLGPETTRSLIQPAQEVAVHDTLY